VRNGGDPIPQAQLAGVFEAFQRGGNDPNGLGLGLFIVREIAHAHRGSVAVTSDADGTVFTFRLPRSNALENAVNREEGGAASGEVPLPAFPSV